MIKGKTSRLSKSIYINVCFIFIFIFSQSILFCCRRYRIYRTRGV